MLPLIYNAHCPKATGKERDLVCSLGILQCSLNKKKHLLPLFLHVTMEVINRYVFVFERKTHIGNQ